MNAPSVWEWLRYVEWDVLPRSPFAEAVRALKLPHTLRGDGNLAVRTTRQDLVRVRDYCNGSGVAKQKLFPASGFVDFSAYAMQGADQYAELIDAGQAGVL